MLKEKEPTIHMPQKLNLKEITSLSYGVPHYL